ncbi:hypothetical protein IWQ61_003809 [Dispira simplex]|nr:hypothetical protein IWQ61_003809 [Dispira simplex]
MDFPDFSLGRCSFGSLGDESAPPYSTRRDSEQTLDSDSGVSTTYSLPSAFGHTKLRTKRTRGSWDTLDGRSVHSLRVSTRVQPLVVPGHGSCIEPEGPGVWAECDLDAHQHYFRSKSFLPWKELLPRKEITESRSEAQSFLVDGPSASGLSTTLSNKPSIRPHHHLPKKNTPTASPKNLGRRLVTLRPSYHTGLSFLPPLRTSHSSPRLVTRPTSTLASTTTTIADLPCPRHNQRTLSSISSTTSLRHTSRLAHESWQSTTPLRGLVRLMPDTILLDTPLCVDPTTQAHFYRIDTTAVNLSRYSTQLQLIPTFDATIVSVTGAQLGPGGLQDLSFVISVDTDLLPSSTTLSLVEHPILVSMRGVPQAQLILRFV